MCQFPLQRSSSHGVHPAATIPTRPARISATRLINKERAPECVRWNVAQRPWSEILTEVCRQLFADLVERPRLARYTVNGDANPHYNVVCEEVANNIEDHLTGG